MEEEFEAPYYYDSNDKPSSAAVAEYVTAIAQYNWFMENMDNKLFWALYLVNFIKYTTISVAVSTLLLYMAKFIIGEFF